LALVAGLGADKPSGPIIRLTETRAGTFVDVTGLNSDVRGRLARLTPNSDKWADVLNVRVDRGGKAAGDQPAMLGTVRLEGTVLRFWPRFPLVKGLRYRVTFNPAALPGAAGGKPVEAVLSLPKAGRKPTGVVAAVYPSGDRLPENLLKFYLHFSAPMRQGDSYQHVRLLDAKGKEVADPFLELGQELWDPSGTRFTLYFDPGRVKRGLKPREEVGPVLEEGKRYTLVVERTWRDAEGTPLKADFRKTFTATAPDDNSPDPKTWKIKPPAAGTRDALRVTFPKSLDHALLQRLVWVVGPDGKKVAGKVAVTKQETAWSLAPEKPWQAGAYQLIADTRLADVVGNSIGGPFEVDVLRPVQRKVKTETVKVPFRVR
jgi:hypothetical protein